MLHSIICCQFKAYDDIFYKIGNISNDTETFERNYVVGSYGQDSIKLGDLFTRLVTPDHELLGGFQTVSDNISSFFAVFNNDQQVSRHNNWSQKIPLTYCSTCSGCWQYVQFWLPTLGLWPAGSLSCKLQHPLSCKMCLRRDRVNTMYDAGNVSDKCNTERRDHWSWGVIICDVKCQSHY